MSASSLLEFLRRELAPTGKRQRNLSAHVGLSRCDHSDLDPSDSLRGPRHDHHVSDHARGHGRHPCGIAPGCGVRYHRPRFSPARLENFIGHRVAASLFLYSIPLRRSVPQARFNDGRDRLCHRHPGRAHNDPSGCFPARSGTAGRVCPLDLVVHHAWTHGQCRRATLIVARRSSNAAATGAGHPTRYGCADAAPPGWTKRRDI